MSNPNLCSLCARNVALQSRNRFAAKIRSHSKVTDLHLLLDPLFFLTLRSACRHVCLIAYIQFDTAFQAFAFCEQVILEVTDCNAA